MLSEFVDRFRRDAAFRALLESDAHAGLRSAGIQVPSGVNIQFARSAASAIEMVLDRPLMDSTTLDDELLKQVSGGVTTVDGTATGVSCDELQRFLGLFRSHL